MLPILLAQLLKPVEPPKAIPFVRDNIVNVDLDSGEPRERKDTLNRLKEKGGEILGVGKRRFTNPELTELYSSLEGMKRLSLSSAEREEVGTPAWVVEKTMEGYEVKEKRFEKVREHVEAPDMVTGERVKTLSDEMTVRFFFLYRDGKLERVYVVIEIHHRYRSGGESVEKMVEAYTAN